MKVRTDFVTNSSSSSFVLQFKSEDSIKEEVQNGFPKEYSKEYSVEMMNLLLKDIGEAKRLTKADIREIAASELYEEAIDDMKDEYTYSRNNEQPKMSHREFRNWIYSDAQDFKDEANKRVNEKIDIMMSRLSDAGVIVEVEYEDHTPIGSCLEQEILPCHPNSVYRFSHH